MPRNRKVYVKKEVIMDRLLACLEDKGNAAVVVTREDLDLLVLALDCLLEHRHGKLVTRSEKIRAEGFKADLLELKECAFQ